MLSLEFYRRQIPEAGVQSLLVIDLLYELSDVLLGFLEVAVVLYVDLTPCAISRARSLRGCARGRSGRGASRRWLPADNTAV
jgi:tryptophan synthase alpha subunit